MSQPRIMRPDCESYYHAYSRVVDRRKAFGEDEKRFFHGWMRRLERFCGVQVVTYCLMSNHFHLLVRVPEKARMAVLDEVELRGLLPLIYQGRQLAEALTELDCAADSSDGKWLRQVLDRYHARRYDLSMFLKELKQRFTQWYNGRNARVGTLWEDKFHSVLVEGSQNALLTVAAYIDLNPIRAELVADPKDYRWSGYGEAVAGVSVARRGLIDIMDRSGCEVNRALIWATIGNKYRMLLYGHGEQRDADGQSGSAKRAGLHREEVEAVLVSGGRLSVAEVLRCKVRYFCDGGVIGSEEFVDGVFEEKNAIGGEKRKSGARIMKGAKWDGLRVLRDLQQRVFG